MHNHAPANYVCPICEAIQGRESEWTWVKQDDIVYQDEHTIAFIGSKFVPGHEGYPLVVPKKHIENIYALPNELAGHLAVTATKLARAVRELYECDGVTIVQNNEPAGDQHAFHFHTHIVPRYRDDRFHAVFFESRKSEPHERTVYAERLRHYLASHI